MSFFTRSERASVSGAMKRNSGAAKGKLSSDATLKRKTSKSQNLLNQSTQKRILAEDEAAELDDVPIREKRTQELRLPADLARANSWSDMEVLEFPEAAPWEEEDEFTHVIGNPLFAADSAIKHESIAAIPIPAPSPPKSQPVIVASSSSSASKSPKVLSRISSAHYPGSRIPPAPFMSKNWAFAEPTYKPQHYDSVVVRKNPLADPDKQFVEMNGLPFNQLASSSFSSGQTRPAVDRRSFIAFYDVAKSLPVNPTGRTGYAGRGLLNYWGPNLGQDVILTRWSRGSNGEAVYRNGRRVFEALLCFHKATSRHTLPGSFVTPADILPSLLRENLAYSLDHIRVDGAALRTLKINLAKLLKGGVTIHEGYVEDPRNTDNAWMETSVKHIHDENDNVFCHLDFKFLADPNTITDWVRLDKPIEIRLQHIDHLAKVSDRISGYFDERATRRLSTAHGVINVAARFEHLAPVAGRKPSRTTRAEPDLDIVASVADTRAKLMSYDQPYSLPSDQQPPPSPTKRVSKTAWFDE